MRPIIIHNNAIHRPDPVMYVCLCNALTDRQIRAAIEQTGARPPSQVFRHLDCAPRCGKCLPAIVQMTRTVEDDIAEGEPALVCLR